MGQEVSGIDGVATDRGFFARAVGTGPAFAARCGAAAGAGCAPAGGCAAVPFAADGAGAAARCRRGAADVRCCGAWRGGLAPVRAFALCPRRAAARRLYRRCGRCARRGGGHGGVPRRAGGGGARYHGPLPARAQGASPLRRRAAALSARRRHPAQPAALQRARGRQDGAAAGCGAPFVPCGAAGQRRRQQGGTERGRRFVRLRCAASVSAGAGAAAGGAVPGSRVCRAGRAGRQSAERSGAAKRICGGGGGGLGARGEHRPPAGAGASVAGGAAGRLRIYCLFARAGGTGAGALHRPL